MADEIGESVRQLLLAFGYGEAVLMDKPGTRKASCGCVAVILLAAGLALVACSFIPSVQSMLSSVSISASTFRWCAIASAALGAVGLVIALTAIALDVRRNR
jgi:hypothetical protein